MEQGQRPFRFGVIAENVRTRKDLVSTSRRAEELGYHIILIRDHLVEDPFGHQLAPIAALATVAAVTETLRIGTLVLANDYRHPAILAKEAATLDVLSGGRFELGLGAGWLRREYEQASIPFDPARWRVGRLEEALRVFKELFAGGSLDFRGEHYRIDGLANFPEPSQRPRPPILVGGEANAFDRRSRGGHSERVNHLSGDRRGDQRPGGALARDRAAKGRVDSSGRWRAIQGS